MAEYIDREAYVGMFNGEHNLYSWDEIDEYMQSISAADVRPVKRGRWIKHNATHVQKGGMYLECSCCHEYITVLGHVFAYCPNCGACMEESL